MNKSIMYMLMFILAIGIASAGSISGLDNNDCVDTKDICVHYHCNHYHGHSCQSWSCDEWNTVCDDSVETSISDSNVFIDADNLNGKNYSEIMAEVDANDQVGGGGIGTDDVQRMLIGKDGNLDFWQIPGGYNSYMLEQVKEMLNRNNEYILAKLELGMDASEQEVLHYAARKTAKRLGTIIMLDDGYQCDATTCILWNVPDYVPKIPMTSVGNGTHTGNNFHDVATEARKAGCRDSLAFYEKLCSERPEVGTWCKLYESTLKKCANI